MVRIEKYLLIGLRNDTIIFENLEKVSNIDRVNSNSLVEGYFLYTKNYIKRNKKIICAILNEEIKKKKIKKSIIEKPFIKYSLELLSFLDIKQIDLKNYTLSLEECDLLLKNRFVKRIDCYFMPQALVRRFLFRGIKVDLNFKDCINDIFMISNDILDYDTLYYKKNIKIGYNNFSIKDFEEFVNINKYLKCIHLNYYNKEILNKIIEVLIEKKIYKIVIIIHQNDTSNWIENNFLFLKKLNKEYNKYLNGEIRISYSKKYIKNNLFKQLSYNNLKMSIVIVLYISIMGIVFGGAFRFIMKYNEYMLDYELMSQENSTVDTSTLKSTIITDPQIEISKEETKDKYTFEKIYSSLNKINKETIGWLTINNTKINYPVVQHKDNEYYLNHDFYKKKSSTGWIFMDYRNKKDENNDNIILYGHRTYDNSQFGNLKSVLNKEWINNKENLVITFDSEDYDMEWEIISVYTTNYTTDYLDVDFESENEYEKFIDMIIKRSKFNFKNRPKYKTKILTLSTCTGYSSQNKRLVVHAKLIAREES